MLGYSEREIRALTFEQIIHPDDLAEDLALVEETLARVRSSYRLRKRACMPMGTWCTATCRRPCSASRTRPDRLHPGILDVTAHEYVQRLAETSCASTGNGATSR